MKYLISYFAIVSFAVAATGDVQIKQKTASGAFRDVTIPVTNSTLLGFDSSGNIGKVSDIPLLGVETLNITGNALPLPPGTITMWSTADIANKPTNALVCDGTYGTPTITLSDADATAIIVRNATLAAPSVTPASGTYSSEQTVIVTADAGATIYYTTNATNPTHESSVYSTPLTASTTTEYRFAQVKNPGLLSPITTRNYTINLPAAGFSWDMESMTATGTGDTSATLTGATLSSAQAQAGAQSLYCSNVAWQYAEFSTGATANGDVDMQTGTMDLWFYYTGTWTAGTLFGRVAPNTGSAYIRVGMDTVVGRVTYSYRGSNNFATSVSVDVATAANTWYRVTIKLAYGAATTMSIALNGGTPVTSAVALNQITEASSRIQVGNYSATVGPAMYVDTFSVTKTW